MGVASAPAPPGGGDARGCRLEAPRGDTSWSGLRERGGTPKSYNSVTLAAALRSRTAGAVCGQLEGRERGTPSLHPQILTGKGWGPPGMLHPLVGGERSEQSQLWGGSGGCGLAMQRRRLSTEGTNRSELSGSI